MEIYFDQPYSSALIFVCIVVAGLLTFLLYRGKQQQSVFSSVQLSVLFVLRFIAVFMLAFLLLGPAIRHIKLSEFKPVLIFAVDNSLSLQKFKAQSEELINQAKEELNDFQVDFWTFGENTKINGEIDFSEVRSDYSNLIKSVTDNYLISTIGGLIVVGDGQYNTGMDPVFESRSLPFPVYTVGIGDTTIKTDAVIRNVNYNKSAFLDNYFPVEVDLLFTKADGSDIKLAVLKDGNTIYETSVKVVGNEYFHQKTVTIKAEEAGISNYTVVLERLPGEENTANNQFDFTVHVISQKQKILFLEHGPHPDISAIITVLKNNTNYQWKIVSGNESSISFDDYDLVIVHQLPDALYANSLILEGLITSRCPTLFIVGSGTSVPRLSNLGLGIMFQPTKSYENAVPILNKDFSLFTLDNDFGEVISKWPPLTVPFGNINLNAELQTLMFQRIQTIETNTPLVVAGRLQGVKRGYIFGEGLWRWRIHNYLQNASCQSIDELILKLINYLILKPNEDNFNIYYQTEYAEDRPITMQAELFNDSFEPVNEADVQLELASATGTNYTFVFDKTDNQYELDIGNLPVGTYTFEASTKLGDKEFQESGGFQVSKLQLELAESNANFQILYQMAANTGGHFYDVSNFDELKNNLVQDKLLKEQKIRQLIFQDFISMKWVFFFVLLILSLEWFLRKFWGSY